MIEKKDYWRQIEKLLNETFGFVKLSSLSSWNESKIFDADVNISSNLLMGSCHEVKNDVELIHYTSVNSLFEIINSKKFRLTNATQTNDPKELIYFFDQFDESVRMNLMKQATNMFVASFCEYDSSINESEHYSMWRNYGDNGNGVGIVFKLANQNIQNKWIDSALGKIEYGSESKSIELVKKYLSIVSELKANGEFSIGELPKLFIQLACLHKSPIWSEENEIRLFRFINWDKFEWRYQNNERSFRNQIKATYKGGFLNYFTEIDLDNEARLGTARQIVEQANKVNEPMMFSEDMAFDIYPALTIDKVILGYRIAGKQKHEIVDVSRQLGHQSFKKTLRFEDSIFTKYFK